MLKPILDHIVINVSDSLDQAAELYARLGFQLTERGHHTLGSSNNLAIFENNYLELLGYLPDREQKRTDLWGHPLGLTGLVFKSPDPDLVHDTVKAAGVAVLEPMHFARPVDLPGGTRDARFAVIRLAPEIVPNGRVFFCHHYTPDLVWQPQWQEHPNGVTTIVEFVIVARDPSATVSTYERIFGSDIAEAIDGVVRFKAGAASISILTPAAAAARFATALPALPDDGSDRMVALAFRTSDLALTETTLDAAGIAAEPFEGGLLVNAAQAANVALVFKP